MAHRRGNYAVYFIDSVPPPLRSPIRAIIYGHPFARASAIRDRRSTRSGPRPRGCCARRASAPPRPKELQMTDSPLPRLAEAVAPPDRGHKRRCTACAAPFYDLHRSPIVCPKCGVTHVPVTWKGRTRVVPTPTGEAEVAVAEPSAAATTEDDGETGDERESDDE